MPQRTAVFLATWLVGLTSARSGIAADPPWLAPAKLRAAVERALAPIEASVREYPKHRNCFSCHHQAVPALALNTARARGFTVSDDSFEAIDLVTIADLQLAQSQYEKGNGQGGGATRAGYALWALSLVDHERDETTMAVSGFLLRSLEADGGWRTSSNRPPSEASRLTSTAVALRALNAFPPRMPPPAEVERLGRVGSWLRRVEIRDTEDAVFRLWGLHHAATDRDDVKRAADLLLARRNPDGGWPQRPDMASDAYATGSALAALAMAGGVSTQDLAYQRGLLWLLANQKPDGTWYVKSRSKPFQPYFESGFPYANDQFISMAASTWATTAIALACATP